MEELSEEKQSNAIVVFVKERYERFRRWRIEVEAGRAALKDWFLSDESQLHPGIASTGVVQEDQ